MCASGTDTIQIFVDPHTSDVTSASGTSETIIYCEGVTDIVLNGTVPQYSYESVLWEQIDANTAVTIADPLNHITSVSGLDGSSEYRFQYTITNDTTLCPSGAVVVIQYAEQPDIDITLDRIDLQCFESTASIDYTSTIDYNATGIESASWSIVSGPTTSEYPTIPTSYTTIDSSVVVVKGLFEPGIYVIRFREFPTIGSQCETAFDEVSVVVSYDGDLSNAGTDQLLGCDVDTTALAGNEPHAGEGTWSQVSGPNTAVVDDINLYNSEISNLINGTYVFRWAINNGAFCYQNEDDVEIIVADTLPNQADAGADTTVCINTPVFLSANAPVLNEWGYWTVLPDDPGIIFEDENSNTSYVEGFSAESTYELIWVIENACGESQDIMLVTVNNTEGPNLADAGIDECFAAGSDTITLDGNSPGTGSGVWSLISEPLGSSATIVSNSDSTTKVGDIIDGTYYFEWSISLNSCEPTRDTVKITVADDVLFTSAGADQEICGTTATMDADVPTVGTGSWIQTSGSGGAIIDDPSDSNTEITGLTEGVYNFSWVISNDACADTSDLVVLYVSIPPSITPAAGIDTILCLENSEVLYANTVDIGLWSIISGPNTPSVSDFSSPTATLSDLIMGTYVLGWTSYGGPFCSPLTDTINIQVYPQADVGDSLTFCDSTEAINLIGNINSIGYWTQELADVNTAVIDTTSGNTATASSLVEGVYNFYFEIPGGGCALNADTLTVTLYDTPDMAIAGEDQIWCAADTFYLDANTPGNGVGTWVLLDGPGGGTYTPNVNDPNAKFAPGLGSEYGIFVFAWEISNGECSNQDQLRVENYEIPLTADAGADQAITCDSFAFLEGNNPDAGVGVWSFIPPTTGNAPVPNIVSEITFDTEINGLGTPTVGDSAVYEFEWTVSNYCDTIRDSVLITVYETATPAEAGPDQDLCDLSTATMAATPATGTWSAKVGNPSSTIDNTISATTTISNLAIGTHVFYWETSSPPCNSIDSIIIVNSDAPNAGIVADTIISCEFDNLEIIGDTITNGTGLWIQVDGDIVTILDSTSDTTFVVGTVADSIYTFRWTVDNEACAEDFDEVVVVVIPKPEANDLEITICSGEPLAIDLRDQLDPADTAGISFTYTVYSSDETGVPPAADRTIASNDSILYTYSNPSNAPVYIIYTVTPICDQGCEGYPFLVWVTINPDADVVNPGRQVFCDTNPASVVFSSGNSGGITTYSWINDNTLIGLAANGNGDLSFTASNTIEDTISAYIIVTPTFTNEGVSCTGTPAGFEIIITPSGQVDATDDQELCTGELTDSIAFTTSYTVGSTTTYTWENDNVSIGLDASGSGDSIPPFVAVNNGLEPEIATIIVTPYYEIDTFASCNVEADTFLIIVNPTPIVSSASDTTICSGDSLNYIPTSAFVGTTYSWEASTTKGTVLDYDTTGTGTINDLLTNAEASDGQVTYVITPTGPDTTNCPGIDFTLVVDVKNCDPLIGVAKQLVSITDNEDGIYEALFNIRVQNYGNMLLDSIQVTENLVTAFNTSSNYEVLGISSTSFDVNTSFDGDADTSMLDNTGTTNILEAGASTNISLSVKILSAGNYINSVTATSTTGGGVSDISQNGSDPNPDGDAETNDNNEVTPVNTVCVNATAYAGIDAQICAGSTYQIVDAVVADDSVFVWSTLGDGNFNSVDIINPVYTPGENDIANDSVLLILSAYSFGSCPIAVDTMELSLVSIVLDSIVVIDANCDSEENGSVQLFALGGVAPYTYELSIGESIIGDTALFETLAAGGYIYTITDSTGCFVEGSFEIDDPNELELVVTAENDVSCNGDSNGSATVVASGGTVPYSYQLDSGPSQGTGIFAGLSAGIYVITVTDSSSCQELETVEIEEPTELNVVLVDQTNPDCDSTGQIIVNGVGGTPPYNFTSTSGTVFENIISGLPAGLDTIVINTAVI